MFCNDPQSLDATYCRYLLGVLRERLPFSEVPIKLYLRRREAGDSRDDVESQFGARDGAQGPAQDIPDDAPDAVEGT